MNLGFAIGLLAVSFIVILAAAELFTNSIEWFGKKLRLAEGAVGSVLAAVGTALPETSIAIIAVVSGKATHDVGVGAILGAPMMLSTLAMFVTGLAVLVFSRAGHRTTDMTVDHTVLGRDLRTFFIVYTIAICAAFVPWYAARVVVAIFLVGVYVNYVLRTFHGEEGDCTNHDPKPLHFHRAAEIPRLRIVSIQVIVSLAAILIGAKLFVESVTAIAKPLGVSSLVLGLIIAPIATELPEKFNSITWVRQKKDTFALGNISGAMVFQSSITPAIGILFTPWVLKGDAIASAVIAISATIVLWAEMRLRQRLSPYTLLLGGLFYAAYPIYVFGIAR
jgi:cation:H+ antiporter